MREYCPICGIEVVEGHDCSFREPMTPSQEIGIIVPVVVELTEYLKSLENRILKNAL